MKLGIALLNVMQPIPDYANYPSYGSPQIGVTQTLISTIPWYGWALGFTTIAGIIGLAIRKVYWGDRSDAREDRTDEALTAATERLVAIVTGQLESSNKRLQEIESKFIAIAKERDSLLIEKITLTKENAELAAQNAELKAQITRMDQEIREHKLRIDQQAAQIRSLQERLSGHKRES